jgi:hypothetical protein
MRRRGYGRIINIASNAAIGTALPGVGAARRRAITEKMAALGAPPSLGRKRPRSRQRGQEPHCCGAQCKEPAGVATRVILERLGSQPGHRGGSLVASGHPNGASLGRGKRPQPRPQGGVRVGERPDAFAGRASGGGRPIRCRFGCCRRRSTAGVDQRLEVRVGLVAAGFAPTSTHTFPARSVLHSVGKASGCGSATRLGRTVKPLSTTSRTECRGRHDLTAIAGSSRPPGSKRT